MQHTHIIHAGPHLVQSELHNVSRLRRWIFKTRSICKMLGPFATASHCTPPIYVAIHQVSLLLHATTVHNNDNTWQRGPLWPHRMGPIIYAML